MSVDTVTEPTTTTTTTEPVRVIPLGFSKTAQPPTSTEMESSAIVQGTVEILKIPAPRTVAVITLYARSFRRSFFLRITML